MHGADGGTGQKGNFSKGIAAFQGSQECGSAIGFGFGGAHSTAEQNPEIKPRFPSLGNDGTGRGVNDLDFAQTVQVFFLDVLKKRGLPQLRKQVFRRDQLRGYVRPITFHSSAFLVTPEMLYREAHNKNYLS